jgi:hypothetical protein
VWWFAWTAGSLTALSDGPLHTDTAVTGRGDVTAAKTTFPQGGEMNGNTRRLGGERFPCASLAEALPHLRRPPSASAVQFKIQNAVDEAARVAAYIDARLVFDRSTTFVARSGGERTKPCRGR